MTESAIRSGPRPDGSFAGGSKARRGWTLFVACAGVAMVVASMVALNTALGDIAVATGATQTQLTWIVDSYTLMLACLLLPAGAIGDRYGRRTALLVGLAIFAGASFAPLVLGSPVQIIVARALAGAGAAFVMPATLSLLTVAYPPEARTKAVGVWAGVAGSGGIFGLLGTGLLLRVWEWQSIFWTFAGAGLALFVLALTIAESREGDAPPLDVPGAVTIGAAVAVFVFGILQAPEHGWTDPRVYGCLAAGVALALVFGLHRAPPPASAARCAPVPRSRVRYGLGDDHHGVPRHVRPLLSRHAVRPAGDGLHAVGDGDRAWLRWRCRC